MSRLPVRPRARGRPAGNDAELRARILDSAIECFVQVGIAGCTLAGVARAAGATPALVNYYFGNKDGLIDALLGERLQPTLLRVSAELDAGHTAEADPLRRLRAFAFAYTDAIASQPWIARLIVREVLSEGGALRQRLAERFAHRIAGGLRQTIDAAQRGGQLRDDVPAEQLVMSLMSLLLFPFIASAVLAPALGIDLGSQRAEDIAGRHWNQFLAGAEKHA